MEIRRISGEIPSIMHIFITMMERHVSRTIEVEIMSTDIAAERDGELPEWGNAPHSGFAKHDSLDSHVQTLFII